MRKGRREVALPSMEQVESERKRAAYKRRFRKTMRSTVSVLLVVAAIAILISTIFIPVIQVSGDSMEPSLSDGDILVLLKSDNYSRGDLCCISWQNKNLLKRVIGLPGDVVSIDEEGNVYVNGNLLDEPYVTDKSLGVCDVEFPCEVPEGTVFVLGDHRSTSVDSRSQSIGCISKDQIVGYVFFKVWPLFDNE